MTKQNRDNIRFNRMVSLAGVTAVTLFYVMNYFLMPPDDIRLFLVPYAAAFMAFVAIIALTLSNQSHRVLQPAAMAAMFIVNAAPLVTLTGYRYPESYYFHSGCVLLVVISLILVRLNFYYVAAFSALYLAAFELSYFSMGPHSPVETLNIHFLLLFALGVGLVVNYNLEKRERTNFVKLRIIVEDRMKLSKLRDARPAAVKRAD